MDVGTSGGVWGIERGYCMMMGGSKESADRLDPIFKTLAPGVGDVRLQLRGAQAKRAPPSKAICIAARPAPAIS